MYLVVYTECYIDMYTVILGFDFFPPNLIENATQYMIWEISDAPLQKKNLDQSWLANKFSIWEWKDSSVCSTVEEVSALVHSKKRQPGPEL